MQLNSNLSRPEVFSVHNFTVSATDVKRVTSRSMSFLPASGQSPQE
jgi:hypothetical protein